VKIELVCPAAEDSAFLRSYAAAILAGLTPARIQLSLVDDIVEALDPGRDLDFTADLAAITVSTKTATRAYELAAAYRHHGVKVVLGGIHPTALPEEALAHADAVVVGEAEGLWEQLIRDLERGQLQRLYRRDGFLPFRRAPRADWRLFRSRRYIPVTTTQASRGCPHGCEFCSVTPLFGRRLRLREPEDVVAEIASLGRRRIMFADDNIVASPTHARRLFDALRPLGLTWYGQASLQGLDDTATVRRMAASGCKVLFIGFESLSPASLESCGKHQNDPRRYLDVVHRLHDNGIAVWASFVLGLDGDGPEIFERTLAFAVAAKFLMAVFAIQTPYPGTALYRRLQREERLLEPLWWLRTDRTDFPVYRPRRLTPGQLYAGWQWIWREFYSASSILSRFSFTSLHTFLGYLPVNLLQRHLVVGKILGGDKFVRRDH
jgi:radical SAM superfamily enzyme YgiQ (UPF0313 family)